MAQNDDCKFNIFEFSNIKIILMLKCWLILPNIKMFLLYLVVIDSIQNDWYIVEVMQLCFCNAQ